jgi:hypothetical protein
LILRINNCKSSSRRLVIFIRIRLSTCLVKSRFLFFVSLSRECLSYVYITYCFTVFTDIRSFELTRVCKSLILWFRGQRSNKTCYNIPMLYIVYISSAASSVQTGEKKGYIAIEYLHGHTSFWFCFIFNYNTCLYDFQFTSRKKN